jgi:hypothetical protein
MFTVRARLQGVADASALAAAGVLPNAATARSNATSYGALNYPNADSVVKGGDVTVGCWSTPTFTAEGGACSGSSLNAVRVTARRATVNGNALPLYLMGLFGDAFANIGATAIAGNVPGVAAGCVYSMGPLPGETTSPIGIDIDAGAIVNTPGCVFRVNSLGKNCTATNGSPPVVELGTGAQLITSRLEVRTSNCVHAPAGTTLSPAPTYNSPAVVDPLASLTPPPVTGTCINTSAYTGTQTLNPGIYCNGVNFGTGNFTLNPGIYVIRGAWQTGSGTTLSGSGVMIYQTCSTPPCTGNSVPTFKFTAGGTANLSAPTSGTYKGVLFWQDRLVKLGGDAWVEVTGNMSGAMYFLRTRLNLQKSVGSTWKVAMIAHSLRVKGNADYQAPDLFPDAMGQAGGLRLIK